ncbi:hypothetical protein ANN_23913 [Periplaneta americana]|uniref:Uncharacterized protein n=1 Tax=Periplaneta americana TaxID=6978 RepID=A0ABQ8S2B8_PERAM|nr:hypothetical protein ANN_23913 [Periplaneta americana]
MSTELFRLQQISGMPETTGSQLGTLTSTMEKVQQCRWTTLKSGLSKLVHTTEQQHSMNMSFQKQILMAICRYHE